MKRMKISRLIAMVKDIELYTSAFTANPTEKNLRELQRARERVANPAMLLPLLERANHLDEVFTQATKTLKSYNRVKS